MCLTIDDKMCRKIYEDYRWDKYVFFKVVRTIHNEEQNETVIVTPVMNYQIHSGRNVDYGEIQMRMGIIDGGVFHAYTSKKAAMQFAADFIENVQRCAWVVPIMVHRDQIVAFGTREDVCFKQFWISQNSINRVLSKPEPSKKATFAQYMSMRKRS